LLRERTEITSRNEPLNILHFFTISSSQIQPRHLQAPRCCSQLNTTYLRLSTESKHAGQYASLKTKIYI